MRAERRIGELMVEQKATVGLNTGAEGTGAPTLADAGIAAFPSCRILLRLGLCGPLGGELVGSIDQLEQVEVVALGIGGRDLLRHLPAADARHQRDRGHRIDPPHLELALDQMASASRPGSAKAMAAGGSADGGGRRIVEKGQRLGQTGLSLVDGSSKRCPLIGNERGPNRLVVRC